MISHSNTFCTLHTHIVRSCFFWSNPLIFFFFFSLIRLRPCYYPHHMLMPFNQRLSFTWVCMPVAHFLTSMWFLLVRCTYGSTKHCRWNLWTNTCSGGLLTLEAGFGLTLCDWEQLGCSLTVDRLMKCVGLALWSWQLLNAVHCSLCDGKGRWCMSLSPACFCKKGGTFKTWTCVTMRYFLETQHGFCYLSAWKQTARHHSGFGLIWNFEQCFRRICSSVVYGWRWSKV